MSEVWGTGLLGAHFFSSKSGYDVKKFRLLVGGMIRGVHQELGLERKCSFKEIFKGINHFSLLKGTFQTIYPFIS